MCIRDRDNIEKRIIIIRGGISHTNACVGGVDNGSNERLCCPSEMCIRDRRNAVERRMSESRVRENLMHGLMRGG